MAGSEGRVTVVVANADEKVCEVLGRVVEVAGHEAVRVTDPAQVSGAVLSAPADALVLDLGSATVDQLQALRSGGSNRGTDARVVVISTGPANARLAWQAGADAVLTRPFADHALRTALSDVLARAEAERAVIRTNAINDLS